MNGPRVAGVGVELTFERCLSITGVKITGEARKPNDGVFATSVTELGELISCIKVGVSVISRRGLWDA